MKPRTFSLFLVVAAGVMIVISFGVVKGDPLRKDGSFWLPSSPQPDIFLSLTGNAMSFPLLPPQPEPVEPAPGLPLHDFRSNSFAGPALCANCHSDLKDETGADVTNSTHWRSTMMANADRDPLYLAKVSTEIRRNPEAGAEIEATCSRCHMPMAYTQAVDQGQAPKMFGEGFLNPENQFYNEAMDGVSCALCHQIQADGLGTDASFGGHFVVDMVTQFPGRALFGPYPDSSSMFASIMRAGSGYDPKQGEHMQTSSFCATCHTLFTAFAAPDGKSGLFPEQVPYLEWQHSRYSQDEGHMAQCQDCHMPVA